MLITLKAIGIYSKEYLYQHSRQDLCYEIVITWSTVAYAILSILIKTTYYVENYVDTFSMTFLKAKSSERMLMFIVYAFCVHS